MIQNQDLLHSKQSPGRKGKLDVKRNCRVQQVEALDPPLIFLPARMGRNRRPKMHKNDKSFRKAHRTRNYARGKVPARFATIPLIFPSFFSSYLQIPFLK
jgi:hypothetical protein